jgi:FkbM family methyltransferase
MSTTPQDSATGQRSASRAFLICINILLAALLMVLAAATVSPKARLTVVWAAGRGEGCSFQDTVNSHDLLLNMDKIGRQIKAASRVIQRDPAGFELVETPAGRFWTVKNDRFLSDTLAEEKLEIYGSQERGVQPGDVVLDCGANVGVFTRTALSRGARLVVAIEPAPATVECLRRNYAREIAEGRVIVCPKGVWDHVDTLELALGTDGNTTGDSFVFGRNLNNKVKVPLTTIDLLFDELHLPRVDFIKMDIEGAEKQALRGATNTIRRFRPRMAIASEHLPEDPRDIPKVVSALYSGYQTQPGSCKDDFLSAPPEVLLFHAQ